MDKLRNKAQNIGEGVDVIPRSRIIQELYSISVYNGDPLCELLAVKRGPITEDEVIALVYRELDGDDRGPLSGVPTSDISVYFPGDPGFGGHHEWYELDDGYVPPRFRVDVYEKGIIEDVDMNSLGRVTVIE